MFSANMGWGCLYLSDELTNGRLSFYVAKVLSCPIVLSRPSEREGPSVSGISPVSCIRWKPLCSSLRIITCFFEKGSLIRIQQNIYESNEISTDPSLHLQLPMSILSNRSDFVQQTQIISLKSSDLMYVICRTIIFP